MPTSPVLLMQLMHGPDSQAITDDPGATTADTYSDADAA